MKLISLVVLIASMAAGTAFAAQPAKEAAVIQLKVAPAGQIMYALGLVGKEDADLGRIPMWQRSKGPASDIIPSGIDMIAPYDSDDALIIYGTYTAIQGLRMIVQQCDIETKKVTIKTEVYHLTTDQFRKSGFAGLDYSRVTGSQGAFGIAKEDMLRALRSQLQASGAGIVTSPIITTLNDLPATISVGTLVSDSSLDNASNLVVQPRVNADDTITLRIRWSEKTVVNGSPKDQVISTMRRIMQGDSIVLTGDGENGDMALLIVTPTVLSQ